MFSEVNSAWCTIGVLDFGPNGQVPRETVAKMMDEVRLNPDFICNEEPDDVDKDDVRPCSTTASSQFCPFDCKSKKRQLLDWPQGGAICVGTHPPCVVHRVCADSGHATQPHETEPALRRASSANISNTVTHQPGRGGSNERDAEGDAEHISHNLPHVKLHRERVHQAVNAEFIRRRDSRPLPEPRTPLEIEHKNSTIVTHERRGVHGLEQN